MIKFQKFPKLSRLLKGQWVIAEKLDGTNSGVQIVALGEVLPADGIFLSSEGALEWAKTWVSGVAFATVDNVHYLVAAQSRNRLITPDDDNYGFARYVYENAEALTRVLGPGIHFGEWWGQGIQRRYGMDRKLFSLFNTARWSDVLDVHHDRTDAPGLRVVPHILTIKAHDLDAFGAVTKVLQDQGSFAAPGFMNPEGVVVFDTGTGTMGKWTFEGDEPKWKSQT